MNGKSAVAYSLSLMKHMSEICRPLMLYLGVKFCSYIRVYEDGSYLLMNDASEGYVQRYIRDIRRMSKFFEESIRTAVFHRSNYCLWPATVCKECPVEQIRSEFGVSYDFSIIYRTRTFVEMFSFGTSALRQDKVDFYLRNLLLFEEFITYFRIKAKQWIEVKDRTYLGMYDMKVNISCANDTRDEELFLHCLRDVGAIIVNACGESVVLSRREAQCLRLMCEGKTCKEVAAELNISPRTVEYYFCQIKQKTLLNKKSELVSSYLKSIKHLD